MIEGYFEQLASTLDRVRLESFVLDAEADYQLRANAQGFVGGNISFIDGSRLYFREYLDANETALDKLSYSYHYQDAENNLAFRYDNAAHKPALGFVEHKHTNETIEPAPAPSLEDVLIEIAVVRGWL